MSLKVLIVDDHEVARVGISYLLQAHGGFSVDGSVASVSEATALLETRQFDVVLLDVRMPDEDGLTMLESIREMHDELPVIILSAYDNPTYIARAAAIGADDYVLKNGSSKVMCESVSRAVKGDGPAPESRLAKIKRMMRELVEVSTLPPDFPLTSRAAQVLRHLALGLSNKEIARSLTISVETVKEHVQNILRKINANDRTDAAVRAVKVGILD